MLIKGGQSIKKSTYFLLILTGFILSFNVATISAIVPSIARSFSIDNFIAGKAVWLYMLPYGISALLYGPLAKTVEKKRILLLSLIIFSCANFIAGSSVNINALFVGRVLAGFSGAAIIPLSLILIAQNFAPEKRGRMVGAFFSFTFISSLLGLFLSGFIFWRWIFLLPATMAAILSVVVYYYFPQYAPEEKQLKFNYLETLFDKQIITLFAYIFIISFLYHGIRQWLGVHFATIYNFKQFTISMLLVMISVSGIFGEYIGGHLADRVGRTKIINIGVGLMLICLLALLAKNVIVTLFLIMFIWGLGWTFNHAGVSAYLTDLPHKHLYESASLNSSIRFLSGGLGAVIGGMLAKISFNALFISFSVLLCIILIIGRKFLYREA